MYYVVAFWVGLVVGGVCAYLFMMDRLAKSKKRDADAQKRIGEVATKEAELHHKIEEARARIRAREDELKHKEDDFERRRTELASRIVSYIELQKENGLLKRDLQNVDVNLNKLQLDTELQRERQDAIDQK